MTQQIPDTSHYDKCRKRLELHEQLFTARAVLMVILTMSNALFIQLGSGSLEFLFSGMQGLIAELTLFFQFADLDVLKTKEGYPQFNIRFTEQKTAGFDYHPPYDISSRTEEMPDIDDIYD